MDLRQLGSSDCVVTALLGLRKLALLTLAMLTSIWGPFCLTKQTIREAIAGDGFGCESVWNS